MNKSNLFKTIVKAYYENRFEETVNSLLLENEGNKEQVSRIIAALCGVEANYSDTGYAEALKNAIKSYTANHKVVAKIKPCSLECTCLEGNISCLNICPFDAVIMDKDKNTTYIDSEKCTECGFCVDACPINCYMDKVEFLPLINSLK